MVIEDMVAAATDLRYGDIRRYSQMHPHCKAGAGVYRLATTVAHSGTQMVHRWHTPHRTAHTFSLDPPPKKYSTKKTLTT